MARWFAYPLGPCLALALIACQTLPEPWQHQTGASHPLAGRIYRVADGVVVSEAALMADLDQADFVLIGERHDNLDHHRLQTRIVETLERDARGGRALAFEMIAAERQLAVVEHLDAHPGDAAGLGAALGWDTSSWSAWTLYEPVARAALTNGGQIVAADLGPAQKRAVFEQGPRALRSSFVQRTGLDQSLAGPLSEDLQDELVESHCGEMPPEVLAGMSRVQRARDAMMADRLAVASGKAGGILIAGNGHVRKDRGVPWYLARLKPGARVVSVALLEVRDEVGRAPADLPYDYVWFTPRVDDADPCASQDIELQRLKG
jgi:uncharacterized iron-regulated protein